ncbi:hypothetical protein IU436_00310 [Nocardia farcinica]|nr:hypothetical protein [Nocardia farcinica]MBF6417706.1 hypothetical protein [Nocardia farcinica]MBF6428790.1 hypothetical protein [Nocardia farcinica]MBF6502066.1 hypothetical protein [Nocardia farcinica]MBF6519911.1 hypothetical protein [Nocardia farcinica]
MSIPRRARHLIEIARAYDERDERTAAVALLDRAQTHSAWNDLLQRART